MRRAKSNASTSRKVFVQRGARLAAKKVTCNVTLVGSDHFRVLPSLARLMAQGAELPVIFDDGCVVVNDVEYWFGFQSDSGDAGLTDFLGYHQTQTSQRLEL